MNDTDYDCCKDCPTKELCSELRRGEEEWEGMAAWSPNNDDMWYEIERQSEKPNS